MSKSRYRVKVVQTRLNSVSYSPLLSRKLAKVWASIVKTMSGPETIIEIVKSKEVKDA